MEIYEEVQEFLKAAEQYGCRPGLDSIRELMHALGDPQEDLKIIQIAGTNGKGSTGQMIAASLTQAGYKTGHFSSPAVFSFEEMYTVNGVPISRADCTQVFSVVAAGCAKMPADGERHAPEAECKAEEIPDRNAKKAGNHPTRFEIETAAAFVWFRQQGCEAAVIEAGMGGTLDATNLVSRPLLSVITPVSMDHMQFLGDTIEEIAAHKAGIIKPGCPVVTAPQEPGVLRVIEDTAREKGSTLYPAGPPENLPAAIKQLCGIPYQRENAACALTALRVLRPLFPRLNRRYTKQALAGLQLHGRMERIACAPDFYIDGAHNAGAAAALRRTLDTVFTERRIIYIMGILADKDAKELIRLVFAEDAACGQTGACAPANAQQPAGAADAANAPDSAVAAGAVVFTVTPPSARALNGSVLAERLRAEGVEAVACSSCANAVEAAYERAKEGGPDAMILAFGSFTILAGIRDAVTVRSRTDPDGDVSA